MLLLATMPLRLPPQEIPMLPQSYTVFPVITTPASALYLDTKDQG